MSLFGTTPSDSGNDPGQSSQPALRRNGGLFDEPEPASSSLFHTDDAGDEHRDDPVQQNDHHGPSSPWDLPTPRRQQSRAQLIRSLLPSSEVPDSYIEAFDRVVREDGEDGKVSTAGVAKVLALARLDAGAQARIMSLVAPENASGVMLGRNEFNVLLALVGLAQEGDEISLDGVDERRRNIPRPELPGLTAEPVLPLAPEMSSARLPQSPRPQPEMQPPMQPQSQVRPQTRPPTQTPAMDMPEDDPWSAPELHKGHAHEARMEHQQYHHAATNGRNGYEQQPPFRERLGSDHHNARQYSGPPERARPSPHQPAPSSGYRHVSTSSMAAAAAATNGWAAAFPSDVNTPPVSSAGYHEPSLRHQPGAVPSPFGGDGMRHSAPLTPSRSLGGRVGGAGETVVVTLMPGKEGIFLFQHHNYEVASYRRGSKVVRRYSDFVWLLDCLHKRYPFRSLPLLPPKRVAVNGNHLSNDGSFIEKRRRGLSRFLNALVRHPVLSQEQLVVMFLTVPTELSVWRKQATISVQDEFVGRALPEGLADSLPPQLENLFLQTRNGVRRSAELYITACNVMDRLVRRSEGAAAEHGRLAMTLTSLTEASEDSYATDAHQVGLLNDGLVAMSRHLRTCQNLMEDEGRGWEQGVLEDLKRQRDALVSLRDMFERRERLDRDGIPELRRRIAASEGKLAGLRARVEEGGVVRAGEMERLAESIVKDKESIVQQDNRSIFIKECIRDELVTFQQSQYHVSRWNQDWAGERVKYAEMLADNWRRLLDALEGMPLGE